MSRMAEFCPLDQALACCSCWCEALAKTSSFRVKGLPKDQYDKVRVRLSDYMDELTQLKAANMPDPAELKNVVENVMSFKPEGDELMHFARLANLFDNVPEQSRTYAKMLRAFSLIIWWQRTFKRVSNLPIK